MDTTKTDSQESRLPTTMFMMASSSIENSITAPSESSNLSAKEASNKKIKESEEIVKTPGQDKETAKSSETTQPVPGLTGQFFSILFLGSIEHGYFEGVNDVYCKYSIVYGSDWMLAAGMDLGITQISRKHNTQDGQNQFVWNLPIDATFRSYNPYGWPQLVLSVYYFDAFGQDTILGYGCIHLPVTNQCPTMYKRKIRIYAPESSSYTRKFISFITGRRPELVNPRLFANGECREALHMRSVGYIEAVLNATFKDMIRHGFRY